MEEQIKEKREEKFPVEDQIVEKQEGKFLQKDFFENPCRLTAF